MKMSNHNLCPSCGEEINSERQISRAVKIDYFQVLSIDYNLVNCDVCGFSGPIDESDERSFELEKKKSDDITLRKLIEEVSAKEGSASNVERSFGLPPRTLNRWKNQGGSAAALALMKLIRTYSWLTKVAEQGYEPSFAKMENFTQAAIQISKDRRGALGSPLEYSMQTIINHESSNCFVTFLAEELPSESKKDESRNQVYSQFDSTARALIA